MSETHKEQESDNEFYDACESLKENKETSYLEEEEEENETSENSDFESERSELFRKFDERFKLNNQEDKSKDDTTTTSKEFIPLHERLNNDKEENTESEPVYEDEDEKEDPAQNDPYYINETQLEKEQASLNEQEKQEKLNESQELKQTGNSLFKEEKYTDALEKYTQALKLCPLEFKKERSILYSNRSICFLKMKENLKCINECTRSIDLDSTFLKPLLRRAEVYQQEDKLDESLKDYQKLNELEPKYVYKQKCFELEELIKERNEKLKTEMFSKLKDLGNLVLKPFGLSTENFQFVQDPSSGSYSVNFKQN